MALVPVLVDNALHIDGNYLGIDLVDQIFDELTIENQAKLLAKRQNRWGWEDLPDSFFLADMQGDTIILPRGYALQLKLLCREHGKKVIWTDRRRGRRGAPFVWAREPDPRFVHQPAAVKAIRKHQQGIYESPTGGGKTVVCIRFIHAVRPKNTIILVDRIDLLNQWISAFGEWFEGDGLVGQIGGGATWVHGREKRITVATIQSLWRQRHTFPDWWWRKWDCMILDECHHVTAESFMGITTNFHAKWRFGVSATPDRKDDRFEFALDVLGEVFRQDDEDELRRLGVLVKPHVEVIRTKFEFDYWPDHESDKKGNCQKPGCKMEHEHWHRNNYQKLKDKVVFDRHRNNLVVDTIRAEVESGPHHHIVISDEIRHLEMLYQIYAQNYGRNGDGPELYMLTGKVTGKNRQQMIREFAAATQAIMFATVGKEGLDIPKLDRVYLPFPNSSGAATQQKVGRVTRSSSGKGSAIVIDFLDEHVPKLKQQFRSRRVDCYNKLGLEVKL